ncbi:hypothetical protein SAMN05519103_01292 [Rhizobiales bacterium GAS113]|nr:hypothetical protein SAMN05519103_01292 [Rhizobiales bacterium GAS113]
MAETLPWWLVPIPWHHGDPGPEVYKYLAELPMEHQGPIVSAITAARGELESVRAKGYAQIGAAVAATKGSAAKR